MSDERFGSQQSKANSWRAIQGHTSGDYTWKRLTEILGDYGQAAIQAERERCAKIAEEFQCSVSKIGAQPKDVADAIRRGGEHEHNE